MTRRILITCLSAAALVFAAAPAHASRDAVQFASNSDVPLGSSVHDAVCFFCSVHAEGAIDHDVVVFFGNVYIASQAKHDVVNFFGSVTADDNALIGHDLVSFFGVIHLGQNASVGNDMVAMFGSVRAPSSVNVGGNRVIQPGWVLGIPFLIVGLIVVLIVRAVRDRRRQQMLMGYTFPFQP